MLVPLQRVGWKVEHDRRLRGCRWNVDTVIVPPCGTAVIVLDTKAWRKNWTTHLVQGQVVCGTQNRHGQVEKVAGYAQRIAEELGIGGLKVLPLLVVHGSAVAGGCLAAWVEGAPGPVFVLSPSWLVSTLTESAGVPHAGRAVAVAARVDQVLVPYG